MLTIGKNLGKGYIDTHIYIYIFFIHIFMHLYVYNICVCVLNYFNNFQ